jgi:putative ATPase
LEAFADGARRLLVPGGDLVLLQTLPRLGERISRILEDECRTLGPLPEELVKKLKEAEQDFFTKQGGYWTWDGEVLKKIFTDGGFSTVLTVLDQKEERLLTERDLAAWFDRDHSTWGTFIVRILGDRDFLTIRELLSTRIKQGPLMWKWKSILLRGIVN